MAEFDGVVGNITFGVDDVIRTPLFWMHPLYFVELYGPML
jgi:hypothetical protein